MDEAIRFGTESMAFAPSVLDAGHLDDGALDMEEMMLGGMLDGLRTAHLLAEAGFAKSPALRNCSFDAGAPRAQVARTAFAAALSRLSSQTWIAWRSFQHPAIGWASR